VAGPRIGPPVPGIRPSASIRYRVSGSRCRVPGTGTRDRMP